MAAQEEAKKKRGSSEDQSRRTKTYTQNGSWPTHACLAFEKGLQLCERQRHRGRNVVADALRELARRRIAQDLHQRIRENLEGWRLTSSDLRQFSSMATVNAVAFSPDRKIVATARRMEQTNYGIPGTGSRLEQRLQRKAPLSALPSVPNGKIILTGSEDQTAAPLGRDYRKPARTLSHQGAITAVAFSPDGKRVLTGSKDQTARLWDATTGIAIGQPLEHKGEILAVAFSPRQLIGCDRQRTIRLESRESDAVNQLVQCATSKPGAVAFRPDGRQFLWLGAASSERGEANPGM